MVSSPFSSIKRMANSPPRWNRSHIKSPPRFARTMIGLLGLLFAVHCPGLVIAQDHPLLVKKQWALPQRAMPLDAALIFLLNDSGSRYTLAGSEQTDPAAVRYYALPVSDIHCTAAAVCSLIEYIQRLAGRCYSPVIDNPNKRFALTRSDNCKRIMAISTPLPVPSGRHSSPRLSHASFRGVR